MRKITAQELATLKDVITDSAKFSDADVADFNRRLMAAQDNPGSVLALSGPDSQLLRAALMCFMFKRELVQMAERLDIPCAGCPGCATGDCADALDLAAGQIAALAQANVRLIGLRRELADKLHHAEEANRLTASDVGKLSQGREPKGDA